MAEQQVLSISELPQGAKKTVKIADTEILLLNHEGTILALEAKCPHANAPLEKGAVCNGRLVCPWHMATFALSGDQPAGTLLEPPALRPLKTYPVRVEGDKIVVSTTPVAPEKPAAQPADDRTFLLIGAGAASIMAAVTLRSDGYTGRIVAVDPVADEPVDRTQLSKQALAGAMPIEKTLIPALTANHVERIIARVTALDTAQQQATLSNGSTIAYDAALLATGGTPKRLDIPGAELAHIIRHTDDIRGILEASKNARNIVIIGTSFIGLEAASALIQKGLHVTVVGPEPLPFAKKFGDPIAEAIRKLHESKGTRFHLNVDVVSIAAGSVQLRDRSTQSLLNPLPADLVLFGTGVSPELGFQHNLPLADDGGVAVKDNLLAAPAVWVAGDIASVNSTRIEHWRLAQQHGQIAARQMLGHTAIYDSVPFFWTFHHGKRLGYLGHANEWDEIYYDGSVEELTFLAFYVKDRKVAAVLSCGRDTDTAKLAEILRGQPSLAEARQALS